MKLPYGNADFYRLVKEGEVYVDRTDRIRDLERLGNALLFLRPRRFGKSLLLRMLSCYYDVRFQEEHEDLFGALAVGDRPTELAHRYFVLEWDFSLVVPELSPGDVGALLNGYVNSEIRSFLSDYRHHLPSTLEMGEVAVENLTALLALIRQTPHPLYLLVDEYDNFANELMMSDPEAYEGLVRSEGSLRGLMKWVKTAMKGRGLERLLFTGVSPVVMSDVTTSLNITKNVSRHPLLADLCGFREDEVRQLSRELLRELAEAGIHLPGVADPGSSEAEDGVLDMMRDWYDGYRFAESAREKVYNPTLVLYFLDHLQDYHAYPRQMLDSNLSMDTGKLEYVAREVSGQQTVVDVLQTGEPLVVDAIADGFSLTEVTRPKGHDPTSLGSFLYYFGMLTQQGRNDERELLLVPPNQVARSLYVENVRKLLLAGEGDLKTPLELSRTLRREGEIEPLAAYVEQVVFRRFSNPDYRWMNELAVKTAFLALLFESASYTIDSEPEVERGRADLCLLRRPDARTGGLWDILIEFKYLKPGKLKLSGEDLQALSRDELLALEKVREAFTEAEEQISRYRDGLQRRLGAVLRLRSYAVVALGFERLLVKECTAHGP